MVSIVHSFNSAIADDPAALSSGKVVPQAHWNAQHTIELAATQKVVGRKTAGAGAAEEISLTELLDFIGSAARGDVLIRGASAWQRLSIGTNGQLLTSDGTDPAWATLANALPFADSSALVKGSSDATKLLRFEIDGFTAGVTRVVTIPDEDLTLVGVATAQTLTNKTLTDPIVGTQTAGNNTTLAASTAFVTTAVAGVTAPTTTQLGATVTINPYALGSAANVAHTLGAMPTDIIAYLECISTEGGWAAGERLPIRTSGSGNSQGDPNWTFGHNATTTYISLFDSLLPALTNKTTGALFTITAAKWKIVARSVLIA